MKVKDITAVIEAFAPLSIQEEWDNSGLLVGSPEDPVSGVLIGFDCTPSLVEEAVACGADMIVTHHPLIFHGIKRIQPEDPTGRTLMAAIRHGIAVYAAHTTADKVPGGVSGILAARLGLERVHVLDEEGEGIGLGAVGDWPEPLDARQAVARVKEALGLRMVRTSRPLEGKIRRVAVCGGSGSSLIGAARASGAQLYLCGDISYHHFFTPDGFMLMDVGHFESEVEITGIFFSLIRKKFPTFAVRVSSNVENSNPIYYF